MSLAERLAGHLPPPPAPLRRDAFTRPHTDGLRRRITAQIDRAVEIFEVDRLLYDIEVEAQGRWLRRMMAFDAYCARRDAAAATGRRGARPVR